MSTASVSVIIPVRNNPDGVARALEALLRQTADPARRPFEIIVVDNASTDDTRAAVEALARTADGRVRLLSESKPGSYAARNAGIRAATGEILAFVDSDCVPADDWLDAGVDALESNGADLAAGRIAFVFRGGRPVVCEQFDAARKLDQARYVEKYDFGATANLFVRRAVIDDHGPFRADLQSGGDYEFGRRAVAGGATLVYAGDAVVEHPARDTLRGILKKSWRVARGQRDLTRLQALPTNRLSWRNFLPARGYPTLDGVEPTLVERAGLLALSNLVKLVNTLARL